MISFFLKSKGVAIISKLLFISGVKDRIFFYRNSVFIGSNILLSANFRCLSQILKKIALFKILILIKCYDGVK